MDGRHETRHIYTIKDYSKAAQAIGFFSLGHRSAYNKPISWQVNSSCTAALYLFLKGLFETKREKKVVRRCTVRRLCTAMKTICLPLNSRNRQTKKSKC